jgi:hypothetical protein
MMFRAVDNVVIDEESADFARIEMKIPFADPTMTQIIQSALFFDF